MGFIDSIASYAVVASVKHGGIDWVKGCFGPVPVLGKLSANVNKKGMRYLLAGSLYIHILS